MREECGWTPATFNRYKAAISKAFKIGMANRTVTQNPARLVPQFKESMGRLRFLAEEEEKRLRAALALRPHCLPQLDIALHTGMRKGEQFSVTWDQVDFTHRYIHLDRTKNGTSRYVHLNSAAIEALKQLKATHERLGVLADSKLFLSRQQVPISDPREWFDIACQEAKIKGVTWHTLRHTFASRLAMKGVPLETIQELMGHKTIAMTAHYAHLSPDHKLAALESLVPKTAAKRRSKTRGQMATKMAT